MKNKKLLMNSNKNQVKNVPIGIKLISGLFILYGLILLVLALIVLKTILSNPPALEFLWMGILFLITSIISITSAIGLLKLKNWAKTLSILLSAGLLFKLLIAYFKGDNIFLIYDLIYILLLIIIIVYLSISKTFRSTFKK